MIDVTKDFLKQLKQDKKETIVVKITMTESKTWCGQFGFAFARVAGVNVAVSNHGPSRKRFAIYSRDVINNNGNDYIADYGSNQWARVHIDQGAEFTIKVNLDTLTRTLSKINKYAKVAFVKVVE